MKDLLSLCLFQTVLHLVLQNISICHADTSALYDLERRYNEEHIGNNRAYGGHVDAQGKADAHAEGETFGNSNGHSHSHGHAEAQPYSFGGVNDIVRSNFNNYQANNEPDNIGRSRKKLKTTTNYRKPFTIYTTYGVVRANNDLVNADSGDNIDTATSGISNINEDTSNVSAVSNAAISSNAGTSASASTSASSCACGSGFVASDDVSFLCFSSKDGGKSFDIKYKGTTKFSFEDINKAYKFYYDNMQANNFFVENNINGANKGDNKFNVDANKFKVNTFYEGGFFFKTDSQFNASTYENFNMNNLDLNKINLDLNKNIDVNKNFNNKNEFNFDVNKYIDIKKPLNTSNQSNLDVNNNIDINKNLNYNHEFNFDAYKNIELIKLLNNQNQFDFDVNKNIDINKYLNLNHLFNFDVKKYIDISKLLNTSNQSNLDVNNNIDINKNLNYNHKFNFDEFKLNNQNQFNFDVNKNIDLNKYLNLIHLFNFDVNKNIDFNKKTNNINQFNFDANKNDNQNNLNYKNNNDAQFGKKFNSNFNFNFDKNAKVHPFKKLNSVSFDSEAQYKAYIQAKAIAKAQAILEAQARAQAQADAQVIIQKQINDAQKKAKAQAQAKTQTQIQSQTFGQPSNNAVIFGLGGGKSIKGVGGFNLALKDFGAKFGLGKQINAGIEPHGLASAVAAFGTSAINDGDYDLGPHVGGYIVKGDEFNYADPIYEDNLDDSYIDYSSGFPGVFAYPASIDNLVPTPRYYNFGNYQTPEPRQAFTAHGENGRHHRQYRQP